MEYMPNLAEGSGEVLDVASISVSPIADGIGLTLVRDGEDVGVKVGHDGRRLGAYVGDVR